MTKKINVFSVLLALMLVISAFFAGCDKVFPQDGDEFATEPYPAPDYSSLELSEYIKLGEYKDMTIDTTQYSVTDDFVLWNKIVNNAEVIEYPSNALAYYEDQTTRQYMHYAEEGNMTYDELISSLGITQKNIEEEAKRLVKNDLVQLAIVKAESIELTDDEKVKFFDKYAKKYTELYGYSKEYVRENLANEIYGSMLYDKMMEYLMLNNTLISSTGE